MHLELSVFKVYSTLIIALFCISAFCCGCWKMYNVLCITKATFCFSFFGHLGRRQCCHFHLPTRSEWFDVSLITCSSVLISTVTAPQSLPLQDSACSSNMRKGALLKCGTTEFCFLKKTPLCLALLAVCFCAQGETELRNVSEEAQAPQCETGGWCLCLQIKSQWLTTP